MRIRKRKTTGTWLHRLYFWLWDGMYDWLDPYDGPEWPWGVLETCVERPARWVLCKVYGHEPLPDQCNMPEHDHCIWCNRLMPGLAPRP